jgi:large subunit ribosomal protein L6
MRQEKENWAVKLFVKFSKMSKIGKKPIKINKDVKIEEKENSIVVQGPKGSLEVPFNFDVFKLDRANDEIKIQPVKEKLSLKEKALWGTYRMLLSNAIKGVTEGWEVSIILEGLGYTAEKKDKKLIFRIGYSTPVEIDVPEDIQVEIKAERGRNLITLKGIDKEKLGLFGSQIIKLRRRDIYKGKGFRWADEELRLKPVKKAVGS